MKIMIKIYRFLIEILSYDVEMEFATVKVWSRISLFGAIKRHFRYVNNDYESALVKALKHETRTGENVIVVGGGYGVTAVTAARLVGKNGTVVCFEGNLESVKRINDVFERNQVSQIARVVPAVVSQNVGVYGDNCSKEVIHPVDIPECDLLELDCEGAELSILNDLVIRPRVILVETHGYLGSPTTTVQTALQKLGYEVDDCGVAEVSQAQFCRRNDIRVLRGRLVENFY